MKTGMKVYFAHPYSSWERGTNENTSGLVGRFYAKNTDFNKITAAELENLQNRLNNRPRKVLGFYSAAEMFFFETQKRTNKSQGYKGVKMGNKSTKDLFSFLIPSLEKN